MGDGDSPDAEECPSRAAGWIEGACACAGHKSTARGRIEQHAWTGPVLDYERTPIKRIQ
jgi:hypothetical protein